jgi:hypothetical protein
VGLTECQHLQLGAEYASSSTVLIGNVDCTQQSDLCGVQQIRGYPTLKYFKHSESASSTPASPHGTSLGEQYSGERTKEALDDFIIGTLIA